MSKQSRAQVMAQKAFTCVEAKMKKEKERKEYRSFAREFPTLVHQCGLVQAVAFALAKKGQQEQYINDIAMVLYEVKHTVTDGKALDALARGSTLEDYVRLCRDALQAAVWLKRYVEALYPEEKKAETKEETP